ncbi:DUF2971 domain-containing protein [Deinococcus koreensis]|uniref:DUF2971 domain-containing protein n=1 Tax=Deinococcus koreensis TaxID=2054903 RepID=A0A2K3US88_9DEIO|nr:DUF2971 domain-containing protein [Deinococcus koreensis]PNY79412.1 hypothetical protein CVO96_19635 [Deinococcus koreensis]
MSEDYKIYGSIASSIRLKISSLIERKSSIHRKDSASVFHYTTAAGLKGIVETNSLWATSANFLNDKEEIVHGIKEKNRVVDEILEQPRTDPTYKEFVASLKSDEDDESANSTYLICFTNNGDQLSQWRGYGSTSVGFCIEFDIDKLGEFFNSAQRANMIILNIFDNVMYSRPEKSALLRNIIQEYYDKLIEFGVSEDATCSNHCLRFLSDYLGLLKNYNFREESEVRASFGILDFLGHEGLSYRVQNGIFVPHLILKSEDLKLPIKSIRVGPNSDFHRINKGLKVFLQKNDQETVIIQDSKIPYRI